MYKNRGPSQALRETIEQNKSIKRRPRKKEINKWIDNHAGGDITCIATLGKLEIVH